MAHEERPREVARPSVLHVGSVATSTLKAWPDAVTLRVVMTEERRRHVLERHPAIAIETQALVEVLRDPDEVHRYRHDP